MQNRLPTEERQLEIIAAALRLAREFAPALITTGDIATAVGITQGAVFKHFPTKDAIWLATMQSVRSRLLGALNDAAESAADPLEALTAVFRAHVDYVVGEPGVPRLIFQELQQPADSAPKQEVRALLQAYRKLLLRLLAAAARQGALPSDLNHEAAATLFVGIVQGLVMQSMLAGRPATMKTQAGPAFALFLRAITGSP